MNPILIVIWAASLLVVYYLVTAKKRGQAKSEQQEVKQLEQLQETTSGVAEELSIAKRDIELAKAKDDAIFASIGEGIMAIDEEGKIIKVSDSTLALLGFTESEMLGKHYTDIIKITDEKDKPVKAESGPIRQALEKGQIVGGYYFYARKDGSKFIAHTAVSPIKQAGKVIGAIEVFRDYTKEKEIDRMKTEFVSLASHQLKAPLTTIRGYTDMMRDGTAGATTAKQQQFLDQIFKSADNMGALISDFLNVTKLEAGHLVIEAIPLNLEDLITKLIEEVQPLADAKKCRITFAKSTMKLPMIPIDPRLFNQVIHNLLTNAIKYSGQTKPGEVVIKDELAGDHVTITVADNGIGIPDGEHDKIFGRLFRASTAIASNNEGTGLGLYLAKQIVDYSGGKIWFESAVGKGTTFFVELPLSGMKGQDETEAAQAA